MTSAALAAPLPHADGALPAAAGPRMVDIGFALVGDSLPRDHRHLLADALARALPGLAGQPGAGIHRLNLSAGDGPLALLSGRTRLSLRIPRDFAAEAMALSGAELQLGPGRLQVGMAHLRELLPHGTLYAHLVAADDAVEGGFMRAVDAGLRALDVSCRAICGRYQRLEAGTLQGFSLMLDGLSAPDARRVLEAGLGRHRRLGCGLFVPHRSASAVGAPA